MNDHPRPYSPRIELFPPSERSGVIAKLRECGRSIPQASTSLRLAHNVADILGVTCPEAMHDQVRMMRSFAAQPTTARSAGIEPRPWKPPALSPAMQSAVDRAANPYRRFVGDGRGEVGEHILHEEKFQ